VIFILRCLIVHIGLAVIFYISQKIVGDKFMLDSLLPIYGIWFSLYGILQNVSSLFNSETIEYKNNGGDKDMFTKKDREIIELKKKIGKYELDNELIGNERNKYKTLLNECDEHKYIDQNKKLEERLTDQTNEIRKYAYELELTNNKIKYLEKFNTELQSLPNVKKTIDSLAALNFTGLDEIERIAELFKNEKLVSALETSANKVNTSK